MSCHVPRRHGGVEGFGGGLFSVCSWVSCTLQRWWRSLLPWASVCIDLQDLIHCQIIITYSLDPSQSPLRRWSTCPVGHSPLAGVYLYGVWQGWYEGKLQVAGGRALLRPVVLAAACSALTPDAWFGSIRLYVDARLWASTGNRAATFWIGGAQEGGVPHLGPSDASAPSAPSNQRHSHKHL